MATIRFLRGPIVAATAIALVLTASACSGTSTEGAEAPAQAGKRPSIQSATPPTASPQRELDGRQRVVVGEPIDVRSLEGRVVFDDFEDVYVMWADGSHVGPVADRPGPEFDGAWAPDGKRIVYRDSRRGINEDDEIYIAKADGSGGAKPHSEPGERLGAGLVTGWQDHRVQLRSRRRCHERLPGIARRFQSAPDPG